MNARKATDKRLRVVLKAAERDGWHVKELKAGWMLFPPDPTRSPVTVHGSPSDMRAWANFRADMRQRGFAWPKGAG